MSEETIRRLGPVTALATWAKTTIFMIGVAAVLLLGYIAFMFKPIANVSLTHCANLISEEVRLSEWEATLRLREADLKQK